MIDDVHDERGGMINDESEVGGWPPLPSEEPPADEDSDGMPDTWETTHDLDPDTDDSADDRDGDGYTNVEEYVNDLAGAVAPR
jgi:pectate lyase